MILASIPQTLTQDLPCRAVRGVCVRDPASAPTLSLRASSPTQRSDISPHCVGDKGGFLSNAVTPGGSCTRAGHRKGQAMIRRLELSTQSSILWRGEGAGE